MDLAAARKHLEVLARASGGVTLGPVGFAAMITDEYAAYRALLADRDLLESLKPELGAMAGSGPSGARIYACLLLREVDRAAAHAHLETMRDSDEPFSFAQGGCVITPSTLGRTALELLGSGPPPP